MSLNWLQKIVNPRRVEEKSRVMEADIRGAGLPLDADESMRAMLGPNYKGAITPDIANRIYAVSPVVRRCADILAGYASTVPLKCYRRGGTKKDWKEESVVYPAPMLRYINPLLTPVDYIAKLVYFLTLYENAFVAIEPSLDPATSEFALWPMNPTYVKLIVDPDTGVKYFMYFVPGHQPEFFLQENVIHIGGFSPFDNFNGLLKLNACEYDIRKERDAKRMLSRYYSNASVVSGVLETPLGAGDELDKYQAQLEKKYKGDQSYRILVLEEGMKYTPMQSSQIELNTIPILQDSYAMEAMVFGVPIGLLLHIGTGKIDIPALEELMWNMTLTPLLTRIEQHHDKRLCQPTSPNIKTEFDLKGVMALKRPLIQIAKMDVAYANTGLRTPNQIRAANGESPYTGDLAEWGDTPMPKYKYDFDMKIAELGQRVDGINPDASPPGSVKPGGNPAQAHGSSPSLTLPNSARDQSSGGEAELLDESGKKALTDAQMLRLSKSKMFKWSATSARHQIEKAFKMPAVDAFGSDGLVKQDALDPTKLAQMRDAA